MKKNVNICKVIYKGEEGGLHTYDGKKIVFQHRDSEIELEEGLATVIEGTYKDMGTYGFADFENIEATEPSEYRKINFYSWKGVPKKVSKGVYGKSIFFKEEYKTGTYIRAYTEDGVAVLYERDKVRKVGYRGENMYYTRLDKLVGHWEDITAELMESLYKDILNIETEVELTHPDVAYCMEKIYQEGVQRLKNGVIVGQGKYENMVLWATKLGNIETAWLGGKWDISGLDKEDITTELKDILETQEEAGKED